ncbi:MAG: translation initiation factor IF-2 [Ureaplasma sp.]|nr:translation initiation factor IF-2 [Ureaplasma sp.]
MAKKTKKTVDNRQSINLKKEMKKVDVGVKDGTFIFTSPLSIEELSKKLNKTISFIITYFFKQGKMFTVNTILNEEQIGELCLELGLDFKVEKEINEENILDNISFDDPESELIERAPIVTIMGHVDHGKTTLLDTIRKSNITSLEAGGITQHIGAYQIKYNNKLITFIDTPGHEAFSEMRARGANVTDIVILVVAADDGLKAQTEEAIDHALSAGVQIIVFVNKMDKEGANPERIISQMAEKNIVAEEWGGNTVFIKGSAIRKEGIDELLESINLISEINKFKYNPKRLAFGTVLESNLDKGFGPVANIIVQNGTLKKGDYLVIGSTYGRVRIMYDDNGNEVLEAPASKPVKIAGLEEVPNVGDKFLAISNEKDAKEIAMKIKSKNTKLEWNNNILSKDIKQKIEDGEIKNLNVIVKADVFGTLEAIKQMIQKIEIDGTTVTMIRTAIGPITETDVRLAQASNAIIVGFNIFPQRNIKDVAEEADVEIRTYNIIYKLKEELENMLKGTLDPIIVEESLGEAEVIQTWKHSEIGTICGCKVLSGKIKRNAKVRIIRDGVLVYTSEIGTLQHKKDQISEIGAGNECGLTIKRFNDVKEGDILEVFNLIQKQYDEVN